MSKYGKTKSEMLRLISQRKDTLSAISAELNLAPSTVSKHLDELQELGAIRLVESEYAKKWKHYRINSDFEGEFPETIAAKINYSRSQKPKYAFAGFLIIAAIAGLLAFMFFNAGSNSTVPVAITDPPYLPAGTTSVSVNYSSIVLNYSYRSKNYTAIINASGALNVTKLVNVTKVIALADIRKGSKITGISINISSGEITINNSTYNLTIPIKHFYTPVVSNATVNSSTSVLIELSSIVVPYFSPGSQSPESFAFVPKFSGMTGPGMQYMEFVKGDQAGGMKYIGNMTFPINNYWKRPGMPFNQQPSIKIENVSTRDSNGTSGFNVVVKNTGNSTLNVSGIAILSCNAQDLMERNTDIIGRNGNFGSGGRFYSIKNGTLTINMTNIGAGTSRPFFENISVNGSKGIRRVVVIDNVGKPDMFNMDGQMQTPFLGIAFGVLNNGTLDNSYWYMPMLGNGYAIAPGKNFRLEYSSNSSSLQGKVLYNITSSPDYRIIVMSSNGMLLYDSNSSSPDCDKMP
ncbi:winged helix-turn-helix domain-containing protein [Candidatus Marsarchaeota archaeon]|nr:winged helix-turn-helix domain-containing protein [Candidatus Marsarchaeota archaeon]